PGFPKTVSAPLRLLLEPGEPFGMVLQLEVRNVSLEDSGRSGSCHRQDITPVVRLGQALVERADRGPRDFSQPPGAARIALGKAVVRPTRSVGAPPLLRSVAIRIVSHRSSPSRTGRCAMGRLILLLLSSVN